MSEITKVTDIEERLFRAFRAALQDAGFTGTILSAWDAMPEWSGGRRMECVTLDLGEITFEGEEYAHLDATVYIQTGYQTDNRRLRFREIADIVRGLLSPRRDPLTGEEIPPPIRPDGIALRGVSEYSRGGVEVVERWNVCADRATWNISITEEE